MVEVNAEQCVYLRTLLFEELREAATTLAEQASDAASGNTNSPNIAGDDAFGTWRQRVKVTAELLDMIGWSVKTDAATIVDLERERRAS